LVLDVQEAVRQAQLMVKKLPDKADLRADLDRETQRFLQEGGEVKSVPPGVSGKDPLAPPLYLTRRLFAEPRTERTLVPEVVAAIEERRKALQKRQPTSKANARPRPRRKILYDDFGEPLRQIWVDD
jgi:hypothetical protein|tara:strand:+ start:3488 stop:3868 length:381 start_codon:yes stop_codon:yes gene_type:complete